MGAFLGVAAASDSPPKFIHVKYAPKGGSKRKLVIIGKGVSRAVAAVPPKWMAMAVRLEKRRFAVYGLPRRIEEEAL
jgi:hypothetical protein